MRKKSEIAGTERIGKILKFWFGEGSDPDYAKRWFAPNAVFDQACRNGFLADYERAAAGELDLWQDRASGALALILLLDQFPRNMFRNSARAFATDSRALAAAKAAIARGFDRALSAQERAFIYLPFEHSENSADQDYSVQLFLVLASEHPEMAEYIGYAEGHREIIRRFGRFPHRNRVLGRISTPEEMEFLNRST
jgi:uncharacterized protein (DUF924 family)